MADDKKIGTKGEDIASEYLSKKGYSIIERNWRYKKLEVDIIAKNKDFIVFAEVKTRNSNYIVSPLDSVTMKKQKFIIEAANAYIDKYNINLEARFDVLSIIYSNNFIVEHVENAFYPKVK
jgi:putative endonuclease